MSPARRSRCRAHQSRRELRRAIRPNPMCTESVARVEQRSRSEAILFISPRERNMLRVIERATRQPIEPMEIADARRRARASHRAFREDHHRAGLERACALSRDLIEQFERERNDAGGRSCRGARDTRAGASRRCSSMRQNRERRQPRSMRRDREQRQSRSMHRDREQRQSRSMRLDRKQQSRLKRRRSKPHR